MACARCKFKGYIETVIMRDNGAKPSIEQCPVCRDVSKYSERVQELLGSGKRPDGRPAQVLEFRPRAK